MKLGSQLGIVINVNNLKILFSVHYIQDSSRYLLDHLDHMTT